MKTNQWLPQWPEEADPWGNASALDTEFRLCKIALVFVAETLNPVNNDVSKMMTLKWWFRVLHMYTHSQHVISYLAPQSFHAGLCVFCNRFLKLKPDIMTQKYKDIYCSQYVFVFIKRKWWGLNSPVTCSSWRLAMCNELHILRTKSNGAFSTSYNNK